MEMDRIVCAICIMSMFFFSACKSGNEKKQANYGDTVKTSKLLNETNVTTVDTCGDTVEIEDGEETTSTYVRHNNEEETVDFGLFKRRKTVIYNPEQIIGEWVFGTLHEVYLSDSTGLQWDTSDDVGREEAQKFQWKMSENNLRQVFKMEMGGVVPRDYIVTYVDDETLIYKDDFGIVFSWDKKNN